ncbi:MAG: tetratricopeptide repeat protein [Planctomycetes bacterium]|nr:tetratricopeptide repeat protein [Planctomycetota bacterium]
MSLIRNCGSAGLIAALLLLAPACLSAQQPDVELKSYERVFLDQALLAADYDAHLQTLLSVIKAAPASAPAVAALRRALKLEDQCATMQPLYQWLEAKAREDFKGCGADSGDYVEAYIDLARKYAPDLLWHEVARKRRGITEWAFIGPFVEGFTTAHDDAFSPEVMLDFDATLGGAYGDLRWGPLRHDDPLSSRVDLWSQQRWSGTGYYIATALVSDSDRELYLRLEMPGSGKLWLNGEYLLDVDARSQDWPRLWLPLQLKRGRNLLLVKVSGLNPLNATLRTQDGAIPGGVVAMTPKAGDARMPVKGGSPSLQDRTNLESDRLGKLHDAAVTLGGKYPGVAELAAIEACSAHSMSWRMGEALDRARAALPDEPLAQLEVLRFLDASPLHSASDRRRLRVEITGRLLAADPTLLPAVFEKAKLLAEDQRFRDAATLLDKARETHADNWRISLALADVYKDADWRSEWLRELRRHAGPPASDAIPVLRATVRHYATHHELANRAATERRLLALLPGDRDAMLGLCQTHLRTGESAEALKLARQFAAADPGNNGALENLAEVLVANGRLDEAVQVYEQLAKRSARPEEFWQDAARACLQLGREAPAIGLLERSLEAAPGQHGTRRQLQRMRGESEDFWSSHALTWEEVIKHDVRSEQFPRADSVLLLDESIELVYADGSSINYVHTVRKILTQDGVDERGKERIPGELFTARTILPDGTVLEPITQADGLVEFPGVKVGCYLDVAYLTRTDGGPHGTLDGNRFYFNDTELRSPFAISRWVLIAPEKLRLNFVYHNMTPQDAGVTVTQKKQAGNVVRVWDVRNPNHPEYEPFMPSPLEFIPWVEAAIAHDWRERARRAGDEGLRDTRVTALIRAKAEQLTKGLSDDRAKAKAIYDWVNATFAAEGEAWNAHQALNAGAGDRKQVFIALCSAAGVRLGFALADLAPPYKMVDPEDLSRPRWNHPRDTDFDHFLCVVWDGDQPVFIDLSSRLRPFGALSGRLSRAPAVLWREHGYELIHLPGGDREADRFENRTRIELAADGSAKLTGSITIRGERAYDLKETLRNTPYEQQCQQLEEEVAGAYPGFAVDECRFPQLADVHEPLLREFDGSVKGMARVQGEALTLELPGEKLGRLLSVLVSLERRRFDLVLDFDLVQTDELRIKPPAGYAFTSIPDALLFPTAPLEYSMQFRLDAGELVMTRKLVIGPGRLLPADYADVVEQVKLIRAAEAVKLKLVKTE